MILQCVIQQ